MNKFLEKFSLYDVFSMLISGIYFVTLLLCLCPDLKDFGGEVYSGDVSGVFLFLVVSYLMGLLFHEWWRIFEGAKNRLLKKDELRGVYFDFTKKIDRNELDSIIAEKTKNFILMENELKDDAVNKSDMSIFLFNYCVNVLEMEGMDGKEAKMQVFSEMSASLFWGSFLLEIIYVISIIMDKSSLSIFNMLFLVICMLVFCERKNRYARYRIENLVRTYYILKVKENDIKS